MRVTRGRVTCSLAVVAVALAAALPASGASLLFVQAGDVWIANQDGSQKRAVTKQGTGQKPYILAGASDSGKIVAAYGSPKFWYFYNPNGKLRDEGPNIVPMSHCGGMSSIGPLQPRLHPSGTLVAYNYFCNYFDFSSDLRLAVDNPANYTAGSNTANIGSDWYWPTWFGKRLVVSDTQKIFVQEDHRNSPFRTGFDAWILPGGSATLDSAEIARGAKRVAIEISDGTYELYTYTGSPPGGGIQYRCTLGGSGTVDDATFSPDGTRIAWDDSGGVKVGKVNLGRANCLAAGSVRLVSAGGGQPRWTKFTR